MALVQVSTTANYSCRGPRGGTTRRRVDISIVTDEKATQLDYADELFAEADANAPDGCEVTSLGNITVEPYGLPGPQDQDIAYRAEVHYRCPGEQDTVVREFVDNFPATTTQQFILDVILVWAFALLEQDRFVSKDSDLLNPQCTPVAIVTIEPTYWASSVGI